MTQNWEIENIKYSPGLFFKYQTLKHILETINATRKLFLNYLQYIIVIHVAMISSPTFQTQEDLILISAALGLQKY